MKRYNKYKNKKVTVDGITYDSKKEARLLLQLKEMEKQGLIKDLTFKNKYEFVVANEPVRYLTDSLNKDGNPKLGKKITYEDDATFFDLEKNSFRTIDIKGYQTDIFKIKRALMKSINNIDIELW